MNKALVYITAALILGLAMTLLPTWFLLARADQQEKSAQILAQHIPFLENTEQNHVETVSPREVEALGISFVAASVIYILFKRRTPRRDYVWPPIRQQ